MSGRLGLAITPGELQRLTDGAADPAGNLRTGLGQAANMVREKTGKAMKTAQTIAKSIPPRFEMIRKGYWPMLLTPWIMEEMERQEQEEKPEMLTKSE